MGRRGSDNDCPGDDSQAIVEASSPRSKLQEVKQYFSGRGLELTDLPTAFVLHEVIGLGMAAGFWAVVLPLHSHTQEFRAEKTTTIPFPLASRSFGRCACLQGCYMLQPSKSIISLASGRGSSKAARGASNRMMSIAEEKVSSWGWLQKVCVPDCYMSIPFRTSSRHMTDRCMFHSRRPWPSGIQNG